MWWFKLKIMFWSGLFAIGGGIGLRAGADGWSRDIVVKDEPGIRIVRDFDSAQFRFITEAGTWMIGFGVLTLALVLNQWVSGEPKPDEPPSPPPIP